ncbi:hypothetical protein [Pedobacter aquatilis]|uniref:hypothetical protein n=1 Tax=Pedobacter aquatilis TaxID=351343 RepID=UPI002930B498|nr:hypothetical protein [Pedobacter aquatilis]
MESYVFLGLAMGYERKNNFSDLDDVEINTCQFGSPGIATASVSQTGKLGTYEAFNTMPIKADIAYVPNMFKQKSIGFNAYYRTALFKPNVTQNIGFGIFKSKDNEPASVLGGIAWQFNDVANTLLKPDNIIQRSSLFLYIGYSL